MMSTVPAPGPRLSAEQQQIVELPADTRALVTAGAGTGKTHCLVHRLGHLVGTEEIAAGDVLVLSFSRAAVREVRDRLRTTGGAARHVRVCTFDSYATWLLSETAEDDSWQELGYEGRIRRATELLEDENGEAREYVEDLAHLAVDEIQDLTGVRSSFVRALLHRLDGGFTLLGDPAQSIYGFQLQAAADRIAGSAALYASVRERFGDELHEASLTDNHRAQEEIARRALSYGPALGHPDADFAGIHRELRSSLLAEECHLGPLDDVLGVFQDWADTSTAVLCRNNGEALRLSEKLHGRGIQHTLRRPALDSPTPAWLARLFSTSTSSRLSKEDVLAFIVSTVGVEEGPAQQIWRLLRKSVGERGSRAVLDLDGLAGALRSGRIADELTAQSPGGLVISTIHRAKGLEFDNVVVVDHRDVSEDPVEQAEEARLLYVAMTRARELLFRLALPSGLTSGLQKNSAIGRWVHRHPGPSRAMRYRRYGMEADGSDVHAEDPAGVVGLQKDPHRLQEYLSRLPLGSPVTLRRLTNVGVPDVGLRYAVEHEGTAIGVTSESFARDLRQEVGRQGEGPTLIGGLRIDAVETVAGSEAAAAKHGMGRFGIWLRPRLTGMGHFDWSGRGTT
ncbi:UvrD-helicase domain-containing protein [Streptomyces cacaoi]